MRIIYVHHGLRERGNPPTQNDGLNRLGIKDAKIVAKLLKQLPSKFVIKAIYTSPYYRCKKTSQIINKYIKVPIYDEPRFNEFENATKFTTCEENGNETWLDCQLRIREAIKDIVYKYDENDTIVCVTSGVNITPFISLAYNVTPNNNLPFPLIPSCSPILFDIGKDCF